MPDKFTLLDKCRYDYEHDPKYRKVTDGLRRIGRQMDRVVTYLVLMRGWPKSEAVKYANELFFPTIKHAG